MVAIVLAATFSLSQCIADATIACQDAVRSHEELADGRHSDWLADCREAAVRLCLEKADKHDHFGRH